MQFIIQVANGYFLLPGEHGLCSASSVSWRAHSERSRLSWRKNWRVSYSPLPSLRGFSAGGFRPPAPSPPSDFDLCAASSESGWLGRRAAWWQRSGQWDVRVWIEVLELSCDEEGSQSGGFCEMLSACLNPSDVWSSLSPFGLATLVKPLRVNAFCLLRNLKVTRLSVTLILYSNLI